MMNRRFVPGRTATLLRAFKLLFALLFLTVALESPGASKSSLEGQIARLTAKFESLQSKPEKRIKPETLKKAKGIVLLERTKAGFIFAFQGGSGVALAKKGNLWGPLAFLQANEASVGFQVGGQQAFIVLLLMHTNALTSLAEGRLSFGGEAAGTAGDQSAKVEGVLESDDAPVIAVSDVAGLYGGAAVKGGAVTPNTKANLEYYGDYLSVREILFSGKGLKQSAATKKLHEALTRGMK